MKYTLTWSILLCFLSLLAVQPVRAQSQACPVNINFSAGDLSSWSARTGLVNGATRDYPLPNSSVSIIPEYNIGTTGVEVIRTSTSDLYGSFPTIPTINGYAYNYSIKLGSTATSWDLQAGSNPGGFIRSVTYNIVVPNGLESEPYTMTYAYAMVLENGTHNSNEQPLFKATLTAPGTGVITCASPEYYLPTFDNATGGGPGGGGSRGATLDSAKAKAQGFTNSPVPFLSHSGQGNQNGTYLYDVWTKGWTEVTFDLSPYRGQTVTLTFQANNCDPGAHFAYAYVALRNSCAGLEISGPLVACTNGVFTYSIPELAGATYSWEVPSGWTVHNGTNGNSISVTAGPGAGNIIAREINGCADLRDTIAVSSKEPTVPGTLAGNNTVCSGDNSSPMTLSGQRGDVISWLSSTDGVSWLPVANTAASYTAEDLTATTRYAVVVQNGSTCALDTSTVALVTVDPKSLAGPVSPDFSSFCSGQTVSSLLSLQPVGNVSNWQSSPNNLTWNHIVPAQTGNSYPVLGVTSTTYYRAIVKSGVCEPDTSEVATVQYVNVPFPEASFSPPSANICYGDSLQLYSTITTGTAYTWKPVSTLANPGDGSIPSLPFSLQVTAKPTLSTNYVLTIENAGCPNLLHDTFRIQVAAPITVSAGNDTVAVIGQPLQLNATVNVSSANRFTWTPATGLNFNNISNPVATLRAADGSILYTVKAEDVNGCYGLDHIKVLLYKTAADIFMPNAFSPNGDGKNDVIRPVCVGISELKYFRVYNRWGQLIFNTTQINKGWDGTQGGVQQSPGTFVYMVQAVDYTGKTITKKGTVVLVR
ncbi:MAG: gliding motility-associated C-terminal domain-containing protein [Candidatus Pseudobacter hemicellulosilyticus]|uniref:Gliding motility-associated C-terminal domain-containing protein n=1 Tax=Candidatus Pseudobacter hemicellulosilyticus TaxID=3121375 RepID=A0AAJ5WVI5_9BACT|nr:MAG: gliding motility-associated C-terminal domain-containing protein [Pseudobacter sp.]